MQKKKKMKIFLTGLILLICIHGFSQQPIFVTVNGGDLYSLDLSNCSSHFVGSTELEFFDIAFTPDGRLWGIKQGNLYQIDTTNAMVTLIGNIGIESNSLVSLNDSILLTESGEKLFGIRISDTSTYRIGIIGLSACGDLTWYDNDLYMITCDQLIKIVLNENNTAILSVTPINHIFNPIPHCEAAVTASLGYSYNSIIGFAHNNAIKICQIDGTYQLLCPKILEKNIPGAASIRLPTQVPQSKSCMLASYTEINDISTQIEKTEIIPNPFSYQTIIKAREYFNSAILTIYNCQGYKVKQIKNISGPMITLYRDNLSSGLYFLTITQGNKTLTTEKITIIDN